MLHKVSLVLLSCLLVLAGSCQRTAQVPDLKDLNVLLIVVDTLGAKHLEAYNPDLKNSPNIAKLAQSGIRFENAYSTAPWTKPSVAGIFTGKLPSQHNLRGLDDNLSDKQLTMAEIFKERGYKTVGKVSHTFLSSKKGFGQGFDTYNVMPFKGDVHDAITSELVSKQGIRWLRDHQAKKDNKNFFMFLHYFDPHYTFQHHKEFDRSSHYKGKLTSGMYVRTLREMIPSLNSDDIEYLINLYHEEIAYTDFYIGKVLDYLKETGLIENTIVVLTADHGEEFLEHGQIGHTVTLYDELVHVPLIVSLPKYLGPRVISENVSTMDILPTLMNLDRAKPKFNFTGISLLDAITGERKLRPDRDIKFEVDFKSRIKAFKAGVKKDEFKVIHDKEEQSWQLHNLKEDPAELNDQKNIYPGDFDKIKPIVEDFLSSQGDANGSRSEEKRSPEEIKQLETLGYM